MAKQSSVPQRSRAEVLLGQPRNPTPELDEHLGRLGNKLQPYYRNTEVPNSAFPIPKDPNWVHVSSPFSSGLISFHHLGNGRLQVHSTRKMNWEKESWLLFSAAHREAIKAFEHRKVSTYDLRRMESQKFSDGSFSPLEPQNTAQCYGWWVSSWSRYPDPEYSAT